jgi:lysozyme family protein
MPNSFDTAVSLVLAHEGGYTPGLPNDPGGETNFGISKRAYPDLAIRLITRADATSIYRTAYWTPAMENAPSQAVANCALDCAVNQGPAACRLCYDDDLRVFQLRRLLRYAQRIAVKPATLEDAHSWFQRVLDV